MLPAIRVLDFVLLLTISCYCLIFISVHGQTFNMGSCPTVPVKSDLDLNQVITIDYIKKFFRYIFNICFNSMQGLGTKTGKIGGKY